jgi:hypothetical protein
MTDRPGLLPRVRAFPFAPGDLAPDFGVLSPRFSALALESRLETIYSCPRAFEGFARPHERFPASVQHSACASGREVPLVVELLLAFDETPLSLIEQSLALVGDSLTLVGYTLTLVGETVALIRQVLATIRRTVPFVRPTPSHFKLTPESVHARAGGR